MGGPASTPALAGPEKCLGRLSEPTSQPTAPRSDHAEKSTVHRFERSRHWSAQQEDRELSSRSRTPLCGTRPCGIPDRLCQPDRRHALSRRAQPGRRSRQPLLPGGKRLAAMQKAKKLSDVDVSQYDAIFMPGGLAPMVDMPEHPLLKNVIKKTYEREAVVGAVCHGPVSLLNVKLSDGSYLVAGKNISSFTNDEEENYAKADVPFELETALTKQGAIFHKAAPWQAFSVADGNLVTGQNPASARGVAVKMIELLKVA